MLLVELYLPPVKLWFMKIWFLFAAMVIIGCQKQPYSKDYIYSISDDHLSLQGKVDLLRKSSAVNDDVLLSSISLLYAQNRDWIEAKEAISRAIKLNPLNPSYHLYLAKYNTELANNIEAYEEAKVAVELGVYDKNLEALLAKMSIETADTIKSNEFVLNYYDSNRGNLEAQLLMTRLHLMNKKYDEAKELIESVLETDSLSFNVWEITYDTYMKVGNTDLAIEYGNKLLAIDSTNAQYYFEVASLYIGKNQLAEAANNFAYSYKYQTTLPSLYLALGNYTKLSLFDSVLYYSDSTFAGINYKNRDVLLYRARAFDKRYKYDESYIVYNMLIQMDSTDSLVNVEHEIVQRKIAYLWRKKREQKLLRDSVMNVSPIKSFKIL